jgi:LmbE family N-acetylglucosaminyl deacetylase
MHSEYAGSAMDVLVLSPHTDDSELAAGGTISRLVREGHDVTYVVCSTCEASLPDGETDTLRREFERVMDYVAPAGYQVLDYPVRRFDEHRQDILETFVSLRDELDPDLVLGPARADVHQDHAVVSAEMVRAFKSTSRLLGYEQPWNTPAFETQLFASLTEADLESKLEQLTRYESQTDRPYFDEEFVRGLARVRGLQGDSRYAEAFEVVRWLL